MTVTVLHSVLCDNLSRVDLVDRGSVRSVAAAVASACKLAVSTCAGVVLARPYNGSNGRAPLEKKKEKGLT